MKDVEQLVKQNTVKNSVMVDKAIGYKISKKNSKKKTSRQEITKVALLYFNQALQQELEMLQNLKLFSLLSSYESYADREENEL